MSVSPAQHQGTINATTVGPADPGRVQQAPVAQGQTAMIPTSSMLDRVTQAVNMYGAATVRGQGWQDALNEVTQKTEAAYNRGVQVTVAAWTRRNDETEAAGRRRIEEAEAACQRKIKESEAAMKRKIRDTIQCPVCLTVPRDERTLQCQNGHLGRNSIQSRETSLKVNMKIMRNICQ